MEIMKASSSELLDLLKLYTQLHDNPMPKIDDNVLNICNEIVRDKNHYVIIGKESGKIISSCVLVVVPNLTHGQLPYAMIENVITDKKYRNKGYGAQILNYARDIARERQCYKIMLMTSSKKESTLNFYKQAGYNAEDKTAFIQWL